MKDIPGFEGLYALTSCGKVWSYRSKKLLRPVKNGGYKRGNHFYLFKNGKRTHINTYYLLAEPYFPEVVNNTEYKYKYRHNNISVSNFIYFDKKYCGFPYVIDLFITGSELRKIPYYYNFKGEVVNNGEENSSGTTT